jgi:hypothetical protein
MVTVSTRSRVRLGREHLTAGVLAGMLTQYGDLAHRLEYSRTIHTGYVNGEWCADHLFRVM